MNFKNKPKLVLVFMHLSDKNKLQFTKAHQTKLPKNKIEIENNSGKISTKIPGI